MSSMQTNRRRAITEYTQRQDTMNYKLSSSSSSVVVSVVVVGFLKLAFSIKFSVYLLSVIMLRRAHTLQHAVLE